MQIQAVSSEQCREGVVQNWIKDAGTMLVVSPDGIVFYKDTSKQIYITEFETHPKRDEFQNKDPKKGYYFNFLFEEGKPYLVFIKGTANCHLNMFINDGERTFSYYDSIIYSLRNGRETQDVEIELTRKEIEARFNKDAYDFMCLFFDNTNPIYIHSNNSNINCGNGFDFSDEKIIDSDFEKRELEANLIDNIAQIINPDNKRPTKKIEPRTIEKIKDLKLYSSSIFNKYAHLLLTVKDGVFSLMWFNVVFVEKDKFRLTYSVVPINIPTKDEIINYARSHEIEKMSVMLEEEFYYRDEEDAFLKRLCTMLNQKTDFGTTTTQEETPKKGKFRALIPSWRKKPRKPQ